MESLKCMLNQSPQPLRKGAPSVRPGASSRSPESCPQDRAWDRAGPSRYLPQPGTRCSQLVSHPHGLGKSSSQQVSCRHHLPPFSLPPLPWPEYCSLQNLCLVLFLGSEGLSQKFPHPEQQCHLVTVCSSLKWATATCQAHEE